MTTLLERGQLQWDLNWSPWTKVRGLVDSIPWWRTEIDSSKVPKGNFEKLLKKIWSDVEFAPSGWSCWGRVVETNTRVTHNQTTKTIKIEISNDIFLKYVAIFLPSPQDQKTISS